jgi:hypothetical protein
MKKIIYDSILPVIRIETLKIDGTTIGGLKKISSVSVDTDCGLWEVVFKEGEVIYSTGNVFICLKPDI